MEPKPANSGAANELSPVRQRLLIWGKQSQVDSEWIRSQSPSVGLDSSKMVLGHALRTIVGDDLNSYIYLHDFITDQESIEASRGNALLRLDWELGLVEIPDKVKEKLRTLRDVVGKSDWMNREQYEASKSHFMAAITEITELVAEDEQLSASLIYYDKRYQEVPTLPHEKIDRVGKVE